MRGDLRGRTTKDVEPDVGHGGSRRARSGGRVVQVGQRMAAALHQRCASFGAYIRSSTEVMGHRTGPEQGAARAVPWMGLLLWMFACAALLVSLIIRAEDLDDRAPGSAVRAEATQPSSEAGLPVFSSTVQAGEAAALPLSNGPGN